MMTSLAQTKDSRSDQPVSFWDRSVLSEVTLNWELALYGLIFLLAVVSRCYDLGARAISHDESLHALWSYKLYNGEGYRHDPLMHGPLLFHVTAFLFFLFGDSNLVSRLGVALFGIVLVMLPYWFRPWLGRLGALLASLMILISPAIVHYSRHLRHDVFNAVFTVLMFIALFQYLRARQNESESGSSRWLFIGAAAVALSLTTKEVAFIHGFIGFTFILVISLFEGASAISRRNIFLGGLALLVVVGSFVLWMTIGNAGPLPTGDDLNLAQQVVRSLAGIFERLSNNPDLTQTDHIKSVWKVFQLLILIVGLLFAASTLGLSAARRPLLTDAVRSIPGRTLGLAALIGLALFVIFYTTFFTNPYGVVSGTWGAVSYWLRQQDVQRGGQPWYYYLLLLLPLYEFLPLVLALAGGTWYLVRRTMVASAQADAERRRSAPAPESTTLQHYFVAMLVYWVVDALFIYSWAGEKMPWLTVHLTLPLIFLAAWTLDRGLRGVDWSEVWDRNSVLFAVLLPLVVTALIGLLGVRPFQGMSFFDLRDTGQWLGALVIVGVLIYALFRFGWRLGWRLVGRIALIVAVVVLTLFTVRFSWMLSFINYDYVSEFLFYAHGTPDVTLAMQQIEEISRRTVGDKQIKVAYDNDSTWPLEWYFREYPNRAYYADNPNRDQLDAPIVIVGSANESKVKPFLGNDYQRFSYRLVWWPLEDYKDQTPKKIWRTYVRPDLGQAMDDAARQALWDEVRQNRKNLWNVIFYRRHETPLNEWPYLHRYYLYIRKDVLNELWDYRTGPVAQAEIEPYAQGFVDVQAAQAIGYAGAGDGQFSTPRAVTVGPDGLLYVADSGNNRIQVLDTQGNFVRAWGRSGSGAGEFQEPWGIAVSDDGQVYVADTWNHRIQVFDLQGNFLFSWGGFADTKGVPDGEPGVFWGPRDIALDDAGNVYVADTGNKRIQKFTADGEFVAQWGGGGVIPGRFEEPTSLAFGPDGSVYVADTWNRRIQKFSANFEPVAEWAIEGWESESVVNKPYVRVDDLGDVYVSDPEGYRILVFDGQGEFVMTFGQYGFDTASFALPLGMAFDDAGDLYVVDSDNNRLLKFESTTLLGP